MLNRQVDVLISEKMHQKGHSFNFEKKKWDLLSKVGL